MAYQSMMIVVTTMGSTIKFTDKQSDIYKVSHNHFHTHITRINELEIINEYKLNMYN